MEKYRGKYRIASTRLLNWDYGSHALYFITICTKNRYPFFGNILVETQNPAPSNQTQNIMPAKQGETQNIASLRMTEIGRVAYRCWENILIHYPFVELDEFIIMPNHVHGILSLNRPDYHDWKPNAFGPQAGNLGAVMRGYKAAVKAFATTHQIPFNWQSRYHDHIIRSEKGLNNIRNYIRNNPTSWAEDRFHAP